MKHTLSVLVEDESGALSRIAGLFARRGFNIHSLAVGPAEADGQSRLTMVVEGEAGQRSPGSGSNPASCSGTRTDAPESESPSRNAKRRV